MARHTETDIKPRPEFSRFEVNLLNGSSLPIFPLAFPDDEKVGIVMVGDYIAQDLIHYLFKNDKKFRSRWLILSTTQSDAVPSDCSDVDFNFFTNESRTPEYLSSPARKIPFSTRLGDGHYVDPKKFFPNPIIPKQWDIVYPAKWYPTKNTDLLLEVARLDPSLKIAIYGWPVISERKIKLSIAYKKQIMKLAKKLPNVDVFDSSSSGSQISHHNSDGTIVLGELTKEEMRDKFYQKARTSIFLSETTEAVNRVCTEMLCCDVPMLVAPTNGGLEKLISNKTGILIERSASGILHGINYVLRHSDQFSPRHDFLTKYGQKNSNILLKEIIRGIAKNKQVEVNWKNLKCYGGDLWTSPETYTKIFNS